MIDASIRSALFWVCLVAAPAVLASIELFHPAGFTTSPGMFQFLTQPMPDHAQHFALAYPGPQWWFIMHMIQTPLVGLVAVGLWLLVARVSDAHGRAAAVFAWLSRAATLVFLLYYTALDSIGGTGLGRSLLNTQQLVGAGRLTPEQVEGVALLLNVDWVDPWVGGVGSFISLTGSWAILAAAVFAALALYLAGTAWLPLVLLAAFGITLQISHASPYGPIAFTLLILAALSLWWSERRAHVYSGPVTATVP